jgi:hypothetical protein
MSLVPTYVQALDGRFYENPVLEGPGWFICFDDDDPPELVLTEGMARNGPPEHFLNVARVNGGNFRKASRSHRMFGKSLRPAASYFFDLRGPIPVPSRFDAVHDKPRGDGVYHRFGEITRQ